LQQQAKGQDALGVRVRTVEEGLRDLKKDFSGLEQKFETSIGQLGTELRTALSVLADRVVARSQPNFMVLISAAGVLASAMTTVGYLALSPVQANVAALQREIVPREEYDRRAVDIDHRLGDTAGAVEEIRRERYQEQRDTIARLAAELREVRARAAAPPARAVP